MKIFQFLAISAVLGTSLLVPSAFGQTGFTTLYTFTNGYPLGLMLANGVLYGAFDGLAQNGSNCGTVFELKPPATRSGAWTETLLHTFAPTNTDGCSPVFSPVVGAGGAILGLTYTRGAYDFGGLYELLPPVAPGGAWTESLPYSFGIDSGSVVSNLIGGGGSFYLLTSGGSYGFGALFQLQPPNCPWRSLDGNRPLQLSGLRPAQLPGHRSRRSALRRDLSQRGGTRPDIPAYAPAAPGGAWTETVLYNLLSGQGSNPDTLTVAGDGTLYGTTYGTDFGEGGAGTVYELAPPAVAGGTSTYTMLKNFGVNHPDQQLIVRDGNLFGSIGTQQGGAVFELHPPPQPGGDWSITFPHNFTNGQAPGDAMIIDKAGTLFGATQDFNAQPSSGTVYEIAP